MNSILKYILIPVDGFCSRVLAAVGALALVQFPNFVVHYLQRLGGHIDELKRMLDQYNQAAAMTGKTFEQYVILHKTSNVPEIAQTGRIIESSAERYLELKTALDQISQSPSFLKFFAFLKNADYEIFKSTLVNYTPGFSFNSECIVYALAGLAAASFFYFILKIMLKTLFDKISNPPRKN
jgi:uncharacterized protein YoxC